MRGSKYKRVKLAPLITCKACLPQGSLNNNCSQSRAHLLYVLKSSWAHCLGHQWPNLSLKFNDGKVRFRSIEEVSATILIGQVCGIPVRTQVGLASLTNHRDLL